MAICTTNRTSLNEDAEHIIADEHCIGDFGATDLITESYYNDQAIFEAVLKTLAGIDYPSVPCNIKE